MKGVVFTEFLEMVESRFSADMVDDIIADANLDHLGAYTAVGTYDHEELVALVCALARRSGRAVPALIHAFGRHLFDRFLVGFPGFFADVDGAVAFLSGIEHIIHAEVLKLYPDAQLPRFDVTPHPQGLDLLYRSPRHFEDLAHGLIEGAVEHWGGGYRILRTSCEQGTLFELRCGQ